MIKVVYDKVNAFSGKNHLIGEEESFAMNSVAETIANKKSSVINILNKYGIPLSDKPSNEELLSGMFMGFNANPAFTKEFAELSVKKTANFSNATTDVKAAVTGDPYLSAINGIVGGIGGILSIFSHPDNTALASQTNAQMLALITAKETARKRNNIIAISSIIALVIGVTIGLVMYAKKASNNV